MSKKLFLRLDRASLSTSDIDAFSKGTRVTDVDRTADLYSFDFAPVVLDHALLLLGGNNSKFGFDLWHYLHSASGFFGQTPDGFVVMPNSTPDFKRRFSEDLGVAIGSLLLVDALGVRLETVAQIPTNKKLDKHSKVPDFVAFDRTGLKRVYECKGTTVPNDVDKHRQKAKDQLAQHEESGVPKHAMVTYIPSSTKLLPPFLFVSDPPIKLPLISEAIAAGLHYLLAFEFAGQADLTTLLRQLLSRRHLIDEVMAAGEEPSWEDQNALANLCINFREAANALSEQNGLQDFNGQSFLGVWHVAREADHAVRAFTGVSIDQVRQLSSSFMVLRDIHKAVDIPRFQDASITSDSEPALFSLFSDGTLLLIEKEAGKQ